MDAYPVKKAEKGTEAKVSNRTGKKQDQKCEVVNRVTAEENYLLNSGRSIMLLRMPNSEIEGGIYGNYRTAKESFVKLRNVDKVKDLVEASEASKIGSTLCPSLLFQETD
ncbi:unnamed protein product [Dovyalis caffra]|uniref:Uncharacterized protein n=1 Tax=Dovyalis caffra TaxID=77055 RepID=A0AAV1S7W9_9ROSI|nr:unnamed protein product [Dovyalis caffra]